MLRTLCLMLILAGLLFSQTSLLLENESGYTSNVFSNYTQAADYYTGLSLQANQDWLQEQSGVRLFYHGELDAYRQYRDRTYQQHGLGIAYYQAADESATRFQAGLTMQKRFHSDTYRLYQQEQIISYANLRWIPLESLYLYLGLNFTYTRYPLLTVFSYQQPSIFLRMGWFLPNGTSILTEANLLSKSYLDNSSGSTSAESVDVITQGQGASLQGVFSMRLAQSIAPTCGASIELLGRHNFSNSVRYLGTSDGYYYSDEELYDDVFGYHGYSVTPSVKKLLSSTWTLQLGGTLLWKYYDRRPAMQADGLPYEDERLRSDQRSLLWLSLEKKIKWANNGQPLALKLGLSHMQNQSNDSYYSYRSDFISLGLSKNF